MLLFCYNYDMNETYKPETLLVRRDGEIDDGYYDAIYQERKREVLSAAGQQVLAAMGRPVRNFRLNMLDLLSHEA